MDLNLHYELKKQHYHDLLREAEMERLVQKLDLREAGTLRSFAAWFWGKLTQATARLRVFFKHHQTFPPQSSNSLSGDSQV